MACWFCRHYRQDAKASEFFAFDGSGLCREAPTAVRVNDLHACSRFAERETGLVATVFGNYHPFIGKADRETERRKDAERRLKRANRLLREARR
jgi:hypothetical protein